MADIANTVYDTAIIGSGPGGYVGAIRASQLGLKTIVIEMDKAGGVCGNWGCIPSKALLHQASMYENIAHLEKMGIKVDASGFNYSRVQALSRKAATKSGKGVEFLLKKNKVELLFGRARFAAAKVNTKGSAVKELIVSTAGAGVPKAEGSAGKAGATTAGSAGAEIRVKAKSVIVATGSRPKAIPGFECDNERVLDSTGILSLKELPKSLLILGAGAIGMEFAYLMNAFGVKVSVIEMMPRILPLEDAEISAFAQGIFKKQGIEIFTSVKASGLSKAQLGSTLSISLTLESADGAKSSLSGEKLLVAVGRTPNTEGLGLEELSIRLSDKKNCLPVGDYYQTSHSGVYAIGDVIDTPLLAHLASKEAEIAVEHIARTLAKGGKSTQTSGQANSGASWGIETKVLPNEIPSAVYTEPGIASFGYTESSAQEAGLKFSAFVFPYNGIGKASAIEKMNGMVKIIYADETHEILGAHIVGYNATELIHELLLAKKTELLPEDIATMIHAHPTISEGIMEASRGAEGWAIHI